MVPFTAHARPAATVAGATRLSVQLWLRPQIAAAQRFATAVSTPGNPMFHRYLSPDNYADRFGASRSEASAVESWLRAEGFTAVHADAQHSYVRATAATSTINAAFQVHLKLYRASARVSAGPYALRANDRPVSVPAPVAASILGVTGLDNAAPILPLERHDATATGRYGAVSGPWPASPPPGSAAGSGSAARSGAAASRSAPCSHYYGQHLDTGLPRRFGSTRFPTLVCGYSARQIRAAYHVTGTRTGAGQTLALVELGLTRDMFLTLKDYAAANHMPAPARSRYRQLPLGRGSACGDPFDQEEQLDVEASYDMAPGPRPPTRSPSPSAAPRWGSARPAAGCSRPAGPAVNPCGGNTSGSHL